MDNMVFWKILKSLFGARSEEFKRKLDYVLSWDNSIIGNDLWIKMLKYMQSTFEKTKQMPLDQVFVAQFPETSWYFDNTESVSDADALSQLISIFENNCMNRIASMKLQEYSQHVAINGLTYEGLNELKKYAKSTNNDLVELSPEDEYNNRVINTTSMRTGISEIDELISIPKGAVVTIAGFTGSFKCVEANTLIPTNYGLKTIESIVNDYRYQDIKVLTANGYRNIYDVHYDGYKQTIKVFVEGRLVETSPVHKFRVIRKNNNIEWVCAKDLNLSDCVLIKKEFIRKDFGNNKNLTFFNFRKQYKELFKDNPPNNELCTKKWASLPFSKDYYKDRFQTNINSVREFVESLNILDENCLFPDYVLTANPEAQASFIYHLFKKYATQTTGCDNYIGVNSRNFNFLNKLSVLLLSFETTTRIIQISNNMWRLTTTGYYGKFDLVRAASFVDENKKVIMLDLNAIPKDESLDISVAENLVSNLKRKQCRSLEEKREYLIQQRITNVIVNNDGGFLYDLSVMGDPTYIANGCVTHNTTTAANIVYRNVYENGYNFAYISLEVTKFDMMLNLWCRHSLNPKFDKSMRIPTKLARDGKLSEEQKRYLFDVIVPDFNNNSKGKLRIIDEGSFKNFSEGEIITKLEEIDDEFERKLDGVVLDHANLCKFYSSSENTTESTNRYVSLFRRLSNAFRIDNETNEMRGLTAILLAQTNRTGWHEAAKKGGAYDLTALAEANELERCSSVILSVFHDKNLCAANELKVCLLKNRYGAVHVDPIITDVYPEYYYVGDHLDGFEYDQSIISMDDFYDSKPKDFGFSNDTSMYDCDEVLY